MIGKVPLKALGTYRLNSVSQVPLSPLSKDQKRAGQSQDAPSWLELRFPGAASLVSPLVGAAHQPSDPQLPFTYDDGDVPIYPPPPGAPG
jgi:hypothetical protein